MLDENLPTYRFKPSSDSPLHTILYFNHNGSDPSPSYLLMSADPAQPAFRNKYAVALTEASSTSIIYGETLVEPSWSQPTLSAAELRAQNQSGPLPSATPITPDTVTLHLYNPDAQVTIRSKPGSWGKSDSWEFELPETSFLAPSASALDRETAPDGVAAGIDVPKVVFRWKKESRLSKDMTCYMVGKSLGGRKSKEPDITIAMFKDGRGSACGSVTIYEPNLRRVEVQDQKGLDIVLLLGAEVIRDLYLNPKNDPFNVSGGDGAVATAAAAGASTAGRRRRSRAQSASPAPPAAMSGAMSAAAVPPSTSTPNAAAPQKQQKIDSETKRLQEMVAEEERQVRAREQHDAQEAQRIQAMMEREESVRRRKAAEVDAETERLRKQYGVEGQNYGPGGGGRGAPQQNPVAEGPAPGLPPRPGYPQQQQHQGANWFSGGRPAAPPRPSSVGAQSPQMSGANSACGAGAGRGGGGGGAPDKKPSNPLSGLLGSNGLYGNPASSVSNFFHRHRDGGGGDGERVRGVDGADEEDRSKIRKKRSVHF